MDRIVSCVALVGLCLSMVFLPALPARAGVYDESLGRRSAAHPPLSPSQAETDGRGPVAAAAAATAWYFAEGYTGAGFDEYLTLQNPNPQAAQVRITYYLNGGAPVVKNVNVPANSRYTVAVHDTAEGVGRGREVAAKVESVNGVGVVAERPIYFTYGNGVTGGHNVMGVNAPRSSWLFAEGYTGAGFDEYLTILNPHPSPAPVTITYYLRAGDPVVKNLTVAAASRRTVTVHDAAEGVGRGREVSAKLESSVAGGVVVERPIYFRYTGSMGAVTGGHTVMGAAGPQSAWHFAEGNTNAGWDEFLTIMNPFAETATVRLTYYVVGSPTPPTKEITAPGNSRSTVVVHDALQGVGRGKALGTKVESVNGVGVVVERPIYFKYSASVDGGHDVMGASAPAPTWLFAEGYTGAGFDQYLVILNPHATAAPVTITYYLNGGGAPLVRSLTVAPVSRATVAVHDAGQVGRNREVSAKVETTHPGGVVTERPIYFSYIGRMDGGHTAMGYAPAAAPVSPPTGRAYYVAPWGGNGAPGTFDAPLGSVQAGLEKLAAGDTLYLRGGSYAPSATLTLPLFGVAGQPITIRNHPGETPVLDGRAWLKQVLRIEQRSQVVVDGLTFVRSTSGWSNAGLAFMSATDVVARNISARDHGDAGIFVDKYSRRVQILDCDLSHSATGVSIAGREVVVDGCQSHDHDRMATDGQDCSGGTGDHGGQAFDVADTPGPVEIRNSKGWNNKAWSSCYGRDGAFVEIYRAQNVYVHHNESRDGVVFAEAAGDTSGVRLMYNQVANEQFLTTHQANGLEVAHNTVRNTLTGLDTSPMIWIGSGGSFGSGSTAGFQFHHNTIATPGIVWQALRALDGSAWVDHNTYEPRGVQFGIWQGVDLMTLATWKARTGKDLNSVSR